MRPVRLRVLLSLLLPLVSCAQTSAPDPGADSELALARELGFEVADIRELCSYRELWYDELRTLPHKKLVSILRKLRAPRPDGPQEWIEERLSVMRDEHGNIPNDAILSAKAEMAALSTEGVAGGLDSTRWTDLGPGNIGGRIRAIAIHPTNPNTIFIGSVAGGIWRTTDGGVNWSPMDDLLVNLSVVTIVFQPSNPQIMYAGTGEGFSNGDSIRGAGILKSVDGGSHWVRLPFTASPDFNYVTRLAFSPSGGTLLASTGTGIWRSVDSGSNWSRTYGVNTSYCQDVKFSAQSNDIAVAHLREYDGVAATWFNTVLYTVDAGLNWTESTGIRITGSATNRIELAWHKGYTGAGNGCVYAQRYGNGTTLFRSIDGGATFTQVGTSSILGSQGWYDNALWVDPSDRDANPNDDVIVAGGIDLYRSTNGGSSFTRISRWSSWPNSAHADHHVIVEHPAYSSSNRIVFFGNDGGIWKVNNVGTVSQTSGWISLNTSLGITQFYGGSRSPVSGTVIGGTQDNGTLRRTTSANYNGWSTMFGGDGGFCASDPSDPSFHYGEYVYLQIHRSVDGGGSSDWIYNGIADAGSAANFIAPFVLDPANPSRMYGGGQSLWRSNDVNAAANWAAVKAPNAGSSSISAVVVAVGDPNLIWVGHNDGEVFVTTNGTTASPTWTRRDTTTPALPNRKVTRITIDPNDHQRVFVTFGGFASDNLWQSTNGGTTWTAATGMPSAPVRDVEIGPTHANWLYAATEVGLLVSENDGTTWTSAATPATISIDELFWSSGSLYLVTHGRGMFSQLAFAAAAATDIGTPCTVNGPNTGPTLSSNLPVIGTTLNLTLTNAPPNAPGAFLFSAIPPASTPLSNCFVHVALFGSIDAGLTANASGQATVPLAIADMPALAGLQLATQCVVLSGGALALSNGRYVTVGY